MGGKPLSLGFNNLWTKPRGPEEALVVLGWALSKEEEGYAHRAWAWPAAFPIQFNTLPEGLLCTRPTQMLEVQKDTDLTSNCPSTPFQCLAHLWCQECLRRELCN